MTDTPLLMDARTAARRLDPTMTAKTLLRMARDGRINSRKRGRLVRFTQRDLDDYVASIEARKAVPFKTAPTRKARS